MVTTNTDLRLFGIDLRELGPALIRPWRGMLNWSGLFWLSPLLPIRLVCTDRSVWIQRGDLLERLRPDDKKLRLDRMAVAYELPQDKVLVRELMLPALAAADLAKAVELEVGAVSPFRPEDTVHGFKVLGHEAQGQRVAVALSSRLAVERYLSEVANAAESVEVPSSRAPEVWVSLAETGTLDTSAATGPWLTLNGFGETSRLREQHRGQALRLGLLVLALFWLLPAFTASTIQVGHRAKLAELQFDILNKKASPAVKQRTELVSQLDGLQDLNSILQERVEPLRVIALMTETLPDDTWLQSLQVQGSKITLQGLTPSAATLMQQLSSQPLFKDVKAPSAAVRQPGANKEAFNIEFVLDVQAMRASDPEQAAPPPRPRENRPQPDSSAKTSDTPVSPAVQSPPAAPVAAAPVRNIPPSLLKEAGPFGVLLGPTPQVAPVAPVVPPAPPNSPPPAGTAPPGGSGSPAPAPAAPVPTPPQTPAKPSGASNAFSIGGR